MKVKIKGQEYEFSFDSIWGVLYDFETLTQGKVEYDGKLMLHNHIAIFGILIRKNEDFLLNFDEFIEAMNDLELSKSLLNYYLKRMEQLTRFTNEEADESKKKRKD